MASPFLRAARPALTGRVREIVTYPHDALRAGVTEFDVRKVWGPDAGLADGTTSPPVVDNPAADTMHRLAADLSATVDIHAALGLAAPQINELWAMFMMLDPLTTTTSRRVLAIESDAADGLPPSAPRRRRRDRRKARMAGSNNWESVAATAAMTRPPTTFTTVINPVVLSTANDQVVCPEGCLSLPDVRVLVRRPASITVQYYTLDGVRVTERLDGLPAVVFQHEFDHLQGIMHTDRELKTFVDRPEQEELDIAMGWYLEQLATEYGVVRE